MSTIVLPYGGDAGDLWAITSYFNPAGFRRRLANYRLFRERLIVPLVAVELAYGPNFELSGKDADILVQLRGHDVMWQKERLLNLALRALPATCRKVVWLDCDVVFERNDWPESLSDLLDRFIVVQPFTQVHHLPRDWTSGEIRTAEFEFGQFSVPFAIASGTPTEICLDNLNDSRRGASAKGHAWAARRELLDQCGFYDACIVGGGDRALASAFYGYFDKTMNVHCMNGRQRDHYEAWAKSCHETARAEVTFLNGDLFHLWHGEMLNRPRRARHQALERFHFDPTEDIAVHCSGYWRWSSDKQEMHKYVVEYFASRREDG
jgi:hypothetical protein